jgi:tRNA(fMet)-specific endonuclease VapC
MILLDTDMMTTLHAPASSARDRLVQRLETADEAGEEVVVSIVSFEEQMRGWMSVISRARDAAGQVPGYEHLRRLIDQYHEMQVLDFGDSAASRFQALRRRTAGQTRWT